MSRWTVDILCIAGDCTLQWLWFSGRFHAVMSLACTSAAQERFHQNVGEWRQSAAIWSQHGKAAAPLPPKDTSGKSVLILACFTVSYLTSTTFGLISMSGCQVENWYWCTIGYFVYLDLLQGMFMYSCIDIDRNTSFMCIIVVYSCHIDQRETFKTLYCT